MHSAYMMCVCVHVRRYTDTYENVCVNIDIGRYIYISVISTLW